MARDYHHRKGSFPFVRRWGTIKIALKFCFVIIENNKIKSRKPATAFLLRLSYKRNFFNFFSK